MADYLEPELVIGKSIFTYQCIRCKNIPEDVEVDDWSLMPSWSCKREGCCGELMIIKERRKGKRGRWHTKRNPFMPERIEKPVPILVFTEDDFLWKANGSWTNFVPKADYAGTRKMISMTAKKAGLQKRCNPHTFRHSRASFYGNKINEAQLREIFGWSKSSDMPAIYVHLSARNIADAVLVANGLKAKDKTEEKSQLRPTPCPKCCELAPPGASYCAKCGASMDIAVAMAQDAKNELVKQLLKNPTVLKAVAEIQDSLIQKE